MHCPKCRSVSRIKSGMARNKQRYKCQSCGCHYTQSSLHRISENKRARCIKLYLEGLGFRAIERLEGVSHVTVMKWVRKLGEAIEKQAHASVEKISVMELDELWHFIGKKKTNAGSGLRMIVMEDASVPFGLVAVEQKTADIFIAK